MKSICFSIFKYPFWKYFYSYLYFLIFFERICIRICIWTQKRANTHLCHLLNLSHELATFLCLANAAAQQLSSLQIEEDQRLIDSSVEKHVFAFMSSALLKHERFHQEKFFVERVHNLMSEFIYRMPEKIKDLKLRNEEFFSRSDESTLPG